MAAKTGQQALGEVFADHRQSLVRMLARMVGSAATAEDLAHEAYLRASAAAGAFALESPQAFLYRTARNLAIDHVRRDRVRRRIFAEGADAETVNGVPAPLPSPEAAAGDRQRLAILDGALAAVPARARQVLILNKLQGWTYPEIAAHLGISATTVQKDIRLALAHCLAAMIDKGAL